jgi:hypothetical protein
MAGREHERQERRRFITRHDVEDAAASGQPVRLHGRDVITSEAAQRAADLGVQIERDQAPGTTSGLSSKMPSSAPPSAAVAHGAPVASDADLRRAVRAAVVAELGSEAPGLDLAIDKVLKARSR